MNITSTTVNKTAISNKEYADYEIEYSIKDDSLSRVQLSIYDLQNKEKNRNYIGSIYLLDGNISCTITYIENFPKYFEDFKKFVGQIEESLENKDK